MCICVCGVSTPTLGTSLSTVPVEGLWDICSWVQQAEVSMASVRTEESEEIEDHTPKMVDISHTEVTKVTCRTAGNHYICQHNGTV